MKSKKLFSVVLTFIMAVGLMTRCGANNQQQSVSDSDNQTTNVSDTESKDLETASDTEGTSTSTDGGKTLVVYYSATGNTKDVAETIAQVTGGNLFEIVTDAFECKEYKPELLFKDGKILNNIRNHPMAIWKMEQ